MQNNNILGISKRHFTVYIITFLISIGLIFCVFVPDENWSMICVSIGTGGVTSALVGYFIDLANRQQTLDIRSKSLAEFVIQYKQYIQQFMFDVFFILVFHYNELEKTKCYSISLNNFKEKFPLKFEKFEFEAFEFVRDKNSIKTNEEKHYKYLCSKNVLQNTRFRILNIAACIEKIIAQDLYNLTDYFDQDEIKLMTTIYMYINNTGFNNFEDYFYVFNLLTDKSFTKILGLYPIDNIKYYYEYEKVNEIKQNDIQWSIFNSNLNDKNKSIEEL